MQYSKAAAYFENGIGNFVLFTSALQAISKKWCFGGKVDLIIRKDFKDARIVGVKDIASKLDVIGNIIEFPSLEYKQEMYKFKYKSRHGGAPYQIPGFSNAVIQDNPKFTLSMMNEAEFYVYELFQHGYRGSVPIPVFPVVKNPIKLDGSKVNIALCNGTFKVRAWLKKQWPEGKWRELITKLEKAGYVCWWVGGNTDEELGNVLLPAERNLANKLSITETGGFIMDCALTISTDTALSHIAGALGLDQIVLWGGTLLSKNRPMNQHGIVKIARVHGLSCSPCLGTARFDRCQSYRCMELLKPAMVDSYVHEILEARGKI